MRWGVGLWEIIERVWSVKWHWPAAIILSLGAWITNCFPQDIWSCRCFAPTGPDGKLGVIVLWSCAFGVDWLIASATHYWLLKKMNPPLRKLKLVRHLSSTDSSVIKQSPQMSIATKLTYHLYFITFVWLLYLQFCLSRPPPVCCQILVAI